MKIKKLPLQLLRILRSFISRPGYTLLELLMVVALLGLVMVAITQLLSSTLSGANKANSIQSVKESGQFAIATIERTLRNANNVTTCDNSLTFIVNDPANPPPVTYTFDINGGHLGRIKDGSRTDLTSDPITATVFSCTAATSSPGQPDIYKVSFDLEIASSQTDRQISAETFETTVSLRNY